MWVRLTRRGWAACMQAVADDPDVRWYLILDDEPQTSRFDIEAPYAAWWFIQQRLSARVFGPRGGRSNNVPGSWFVALRSITRELNTIDKHPALKGKGMLGWHGVKIPAWITGPETYTPYPQLDKPFVRLEPEWLSTFNGQKYTMWSPRSGDGAEVASHESVHLLLWRHPGRP